MKIIYHERIGMLKQLRTNTKWIMVTVAVGFVAMMVFDWGMDITSRQRGTGAGVVAVINGEDIPYTYYDQLIRNQTQNIESSQRLTMDQLRMIHNQVWDYLVTNTLVSQLIEERGITVSDQELMQYILNNPIQEATQISLFQENGAFSITKYRQFIQDPQNLQNPQTRQILEYIEAQARAVMPTMRLQQDLMNAVVVTDREVHERWLEENDTRRIEFLQVTPTDVHNAPATDQAAVQKYFEEHKEDFRQEEQRAVQTVFFELAPTAQDSAMVREQAAMLVTRARNGEDFIELANSYSEDTGNLGQAGEQLGGDLGWFGKGTMVTPFDDAVFAMSAGQISEPVETPFGLHIIKVDSLKYAADGATADQVKARHILLRLEPSGETQEAVTGGANFEDQAGQENLQVQQSPLFTQDATFLPGVGNNVQVLVNRIFRARTGDIIPAFETDQGFYVIRVSASVKEGIPPFETVSDAVTRAYTESQRDEYAQAYIGKVAAQVAQGRSLQDAVNVVADPNVTASVSAQEVTRAMVIAGLGSRSALIAKVFTQDQVGASTGPVVVENGCAIAVLLEKMPLDETRFSLDQAAIRTKLTEERQTAAMTDLLDGLRDSAEITDNRDQFLSL